MRKTKLKMTFVHRGPVKDITIAQLLALQNTATKTLGVKGGAPPKDRSILASPKLGEFHEHNLVRLTAYVLNAETADYEDTGESVNCNVGLKTAGKNYTKEYVIPRNDIHMALATKAVQNDCSSVTAEITPHLRPSSWNETAVGNLKGKLVRLTGQSMFDGSHRVCVGGKAGKGGPAPIPMGNSSSLQSRGLSERHRR